MISFLHWENCGFGHVVELKCLGPWITRFFFPDWSCSLWSWIDESEWCHCHVQVGVFAGWRRLLNSVLWRAHAHTLVTSNLNLYSSVAFTNPAYNMWFLQPFFQTLEALLICYVWRIIKLSRVTLSVPSFYAALLSQIRLIILNHILFFEQY